MDIRRYVAVVAIGLALMATAQAEARAVRVARRDTARVPLKMLVYENLSNGSVLAKFRKRFARLDSMIADTLSTTPPLMLYGGKQPQNMDSLYAAKARDEVKALLNRNGLEFSGQAYQRLDNSFGLDDEDQYSQYTTKLQGEVGWNFFGSGLFQRRSGMRLINGNNKVGRIQHERQLQNMVWQGLGESLTKAYQPLIANVLYRRLENLDILNEAYQYTLEHDKISNDRMLEVMSDKMDIEYSLMQMDMGDLIGDEHLARPVPTVVSVDTVRLFEAIERNSSVIQESLAKEDVLEAKYAMTNYLQTLRLTPFVRVSHYLRLNTGLAPSTNLDAGLRFTVPLYSDARSKRRAIGTELTLLVLDRQTVYDETYRHCRFQMDKIEKCNKTLVTETAHLKQVGRFLGIRRKAYDNSPGGYNYIMRLQEYNEYLKSLERLYRLLLLRNQCLIELQQESGYMNITDLITENKIE